MGLDPTGKAAAMGREFRDFLSKTNMLALALGVVLGVAVGKVVSAIVSDLIMPFVGIINTGGNWRAITISFWRLNFTVGHLMGEILEFLIIAAVVFLIVKAFVKAAPPPPSRLCPRCKEGIHPEATRCKFCTSDVPEEKPAA